MEELFDKKYVLVDYENFDVLLTYLGYGFLQRKMALSLRPVQFVTQNKDGTYSINSRCTLYKSQIVFTPGEEFTETKPDGIKVRALISIEGNKIYHRQVEDNGRTLHHEYQFSPDEMNIITTSPGLKKVVKRHFKVMK